MENVNKKYNIIIADHATRMLVSHSRFIAQVNEQAALNLIDEFQVQAKSLEFMPERNPWLEDPNLLSGKYYKHLMGKSHLLVYQIKNDTVFIDYVIDSRQDYHWFL